MASIHGLLNRWPFSHERISKLTETVEGKSPAHDQSYHQQKQRSCSAILDIHLFLKGWRKNYAHKKTKWDRVKESIFKMKLIKRMIHKFGGNRWKYEQNIDFILLSENGQHQSYRACESPTPANMQRMNSKAICSQALQDVTQIYTPSPTNGQ